MLPTIVDHMLQHPPVIDHLELLRYEYKASAPVDHSRSLGKIAHLGEFIVPYSCYDSLRASRYLKSKNTAKRFRAT